MNLYLSLCKERSDYGFAERFHRFNCSTKQCSCPTTRLRYSHDVHRHEHIINILDRYADQVLEGVGGMDSRYAEEDYLNFLQYLQCVLPDEVEFHKKFYNFEKSKLDDNDLND